MTLQALIWISILFGATSVAWALIFFFGLHKARSASAEEDDEERIIELLAQIRSGAEEQ